MCIISFTDHEVVKTHNMYVHEAIYIIILHICDPSFYTTNKIPSGYICSWYCCIIKRSYLNLYKKYICHNLNITWICFLLRHIWYNPYSKIKLGIKWILYINLQTKEILRQKQTSMITGKIHIGIFIHFPIVFKVITIIDATSLCAFITTFAAMVTI